MNEEAMLKAKLASLEDQVQAITLDIMRTKVRLTGAITGYSLAAVADADIDEALRMARAMERTTGVKDSDTMILWAVVQGTPIPKEEV